MHTLYSCMYCMFQTNSRLILGHSSFSSLGVGVHRVQKALSAFSKQQKLCVEVVEEILLVSFPLWRETGCQGERGGWRRYSLSTSGSMKWIISWVWSSCEANRPQCLWASFEKLRSSSPPAETDLNHSALLSQCFHWHHLTHSTLRQRRGTDHYSILKLWNATTHSWQLRFLKNCGASCSVAFTGQPQEVETPSILLKFKKSDTHNVTNCCKAARIQPVSSLPTRCWYYPTVGVNWSGVQRPGVSRKFK